MKKNFVCTMTLLITGGAVNAQHKDYPIQPVSFTQVHLSDNFWAPKIRVNADVTIPYVLRKCRETGRIDNFLEAAGTLPGTKLTEYPFDDTDIYKVIEGASYALQVNRDTALEKSLDTLISYIAAAQEPDGYLYTFRTVKASKPHPWIGAKRWEKEEDLSHELYNAGHLYEAAFAHYQATGKKSLLNIALKNADLLVHDFGYGKTEEYPGHQVVEMGLVKLYRATGKKACLDLAKFFLDIRGPKGNAYNQANKKVVDQDEAEGHAVRATYMYTGMADVAALTGDQGYLKAIDAIWNDVVTKKLYLTGGIGATGAGEAFGAAYELPNMSAYAETCAAIANIFWNSRMFLLHGDSKYMDVLERVLYNGLLSGVSLSGDHFFYPNPLASMGQHQRGAWFSCACCISNMTRFLPSVPGYVYAQNNNELFVNLFVSNEADISLPAGKVQIVQKTDYPWDGRVGLEVNPGKAMAFTLKIRIPGWAQQQPVPGDLYHYADNRQPPVTISINGKPAAYKTIKGYAVFDRNWKKGDRVTVSFPLEVEKVIANENVKDDKGCFALQRGPVVYCLEGPDNKDSVVQNIVVDKAAPVQAMYRNGFLNGIDVLTTRGNATRRQLNSDELLKSEQDVKAIPYYSWANRGPSEMEVWIPYEESAARPKPAPTIASKSKPSASLRNTRMLIALNDQYDPRDSKDNSATYLHWWPKKNTTEWVQYDFDKEYTVSESQVYWFDDGPFGGCRIPASWKLYYKKDGGWVPVNNTGAYEIAKDKYNTVKFEPVTTTALKLEVQLPVEYATGIHEWKVSEAQERATLTIDAGKPGNPVSSTLHGIFFEEISHGGEGGLYGELIQNRGFEESRLPPATSLQNGFIVPERTPHFSLPNNRASDWKMKWEVKSQWPAWSLLASENSDINLALTQENPLNATTPNSLQVTINKLDANGKNELVNEGFWGINTVKGETYQLRFYAHTDKYAGPLTVSLQSGDDKILASYQFRSIAGANWKKYSCKLQALQGDPNAKFVMSFGSTGIVWLDFVSLFPEKTFKNRPNGMRADLAQYLADLKPSFIRWPGGCFVEGINIQSAPNWKRSIGPVEKRPGTYSPWGYWSTDGFGYHEYLQFCEDIGADALYVFNAGVSCDFRSGTFIPDEGVDSIIADILDGIEYAIGPADSRWGKVRAANGHPKPFPLKYVEIGNEQSGPRYARRYNWFYEAIKKKYPGIKIMAGMGIGDVNRRTLDSMKAVDLADEHAYKAANWAMRNYNHFDNYKRGNWDMYVGEYATNSGVGKGNMLAALSDAVYIMAMERNGDLVKMSSYAPLFVNVNDVDWPVNLINFDASKSFARISYYAIKMFNENRADQNIFTETSIPPVAQKTPLYAGGIGLATWDTESEYKDIEVVENGKVVYQSDFINRASEWKPVRGDWKVKDSAFAQTGPGAQRFAWLEGKRFDTYTLKCRARKISNATNAFIIPFAVKDDNTMMRAHIGSYINNNSVFESVTNGMNVSDLTNQKKLLVPIQTGRWYDIVLEVGYDKVDCWLDGKLLMSYTEPKKLFGIAGRDLRTGDIIIKVVNAAAMPYKANIELNGVKETGPVAELITLHADSPEAENSFADPLKYMPVHSNIPANIPGIKNSFETIFQPLSISVLRIKDKSWKKT